MVCSIAFMVSGIMMAITTSDPPTNTGYSTISASTLPTMYPNMDTGTIDIPQDLLRDLAVKHKVRDTVYITKTDTVKEQVTKVKWRKVSAPKPIVERDTIQVPIYYLATQVGNKEGPTGECISVYEVHKVDKICPEIINSSVELSNELDSNIKK